jgi:hypothetical protein
MSFKKATRSQSKLRLALSGPSGSGKTFTALSIASGLGGRIAVVDTERGSASKYAGRFEFDVMELEQFHPDKYVDAIHEAEKAGYDVLVIDSLSHAWAGAGGVLEIVDNASKRGGESGGKRDSFGGWKTATPIQNRMIDAILRSRCHVVATMRSKTEWVIEKNEAGKNAPRKVGTAPVQRGDLEFEFDVVGEMNQENECVISKTRYEPLNGKVLAKPSAALGKELLAWLSDGAPAVEVVKPVEEQAAPPAGNDRERMRASIAAAKTTEELEALVPDIQKLSEIDREAVRPGYGKRKLELTAPRAG